MEDKMVLVRFGERLDDKVKVTMSLDIKEDPAHLIHFSPEGYVEHMDKAYVLEKPQLLN